MSGWLLDTDVVSELRKERPDRNVATFTSGVDLDELNLSVVTLAEIRYGIAVCTDAVFQAELETWLDKTLRPLFGDRILPVTEDVMLRWKLLVERGREHNHTFSQPDLLIAATALVHDLTIVTRNVRDYALTGVGRLDPWLDSTRTVND